MLLWAVIFQVVLWGFGAHQLHTQARYERTHFDLSHCSRAGDSPDGLTRYCLPHEGCWLLDAHGSPACWRVATLVSE